MVSWESFTFLDETDKEHNSGEDFFFHDRSFEFYIRAKSRRFVKQSVTYAQHKEPVRWTQILGLAHLHTQHTLRAAAVVLQPASYLSLALSLTPVRETADVDYWTKPEPVLDISVRTA